MRILNRLTKTIGRRTFVAAVGTIALVAFPSGMAWAQDYPTRPIHLVVPYPAGSSSDATARTYAPALAEILGQPVIVENVGGAAGQIGVNKVTKSPPDGYTLLHGASQNVAAVVGMNKQLPFDIMKDLKGVSLVAVQAPVLVVSKDSPYQTAADLIADAKKRPGELTYASSGIGGVPHLAAALFSNEAGIETRHIPFGAGSQAVADIINGQVTFLFYPYSALGGQIQDGVLRVLANSAPKRTSTVPDVPTVAELGFPDATIQSWQGVYAPSGTPPEIIEKLSKAVNQAVGDPAMVAKGENMGLEFGGNSAEELAAFTASEIERFKKILAIAGIEAK